MKCLLVLFIALLLAFSFNSIERKNKGPNDKNKDKKMVLSGNYKEEYGKLGVTLASFSYCSFEQMTNGKCCSNALDPQYKVEYKGIVKQDDYTFAVLSHPGYQHIVISLTGTKKNSQLMKEIYYSNSVQFKHPKYKMFISSYFNTVYLQVKALLEPELRRLSKLYPNYQYIFTGHSLGGAMSTIFALDSAMDGYIPVNGISPLLMNYASPRVGNYVFASYVHKYVPIFYRIVRKGDPVASLPPCSYISSCSNKLGLKDFTNTSKAFNPKIGDDTGYWHIGGLINYNEEMTSFTDCGKNYSEYPEEKLKSKCSLSPALSVEKHTVYMDKPVSGICQGARKYFFTKRVLRQYKKKNLKQKKLMKSKAKRRQQRKK